MTTSFPTRLSSTCCGTMTQMVRLSHPAVKIRSVIIHVCTFHIMLQCRRIGKPNNSSARRLSSVAFLSENPAEIQGVHPTRLEFPSFLSNIQCSFPVFIHSHGPPQDRGGAQLARIHFGFSVMRIKGHASRVLVIFYLIRQASCRWKGAGVEG